MSDTRSNWQAEAGIGAGYSSEQRTGWATYLIFAGVMLGIVGVFELMAALTALLDDSYYAVRPSGLVIQVDYTVWGWTHLFLGVVAIATSFLLLRGNPVGRVAAIVIAVVSAVTNFAFVPAAPLWAAVAITFNVLVIYAVCAHGGELRGRR
jgi:hypothetical protein